MSVSWGFRATLCAAVLLFTALLPSAVTAQTPPINVIPGFPVVTGFSGTRPTVTPLPPGLDPADKITIDLNGPSLRVIDAAALSAQPSAQVVPAPKPLTITGAQIGQVFSVALDDAAPPNIYVAASSAYGLPITVPDADGDGLPDRTRKGTPNAQFMPGLFGPAAAGGGPGSIWRIDGVTGEVRLFTNVALNGVPNAGPALGGITFDRASRHIFVADRETGRIHRFQLDGVEVGSFDHGTQALPAIGLPPILPNLGKRLDITSPEFDSENPTTWNYAAPARRVFGLAIHRGRLYYAAAAGLRIWSVAINPDGSFGVDARVEYAVPPGPAPGTEISKIMFDDAGHMFLGERGAPTGAFNFAALTAQNSGRVLRVQPQRPGADGTPFLWTPVGEYAIGFPPTHQNGDGGIAIGYGYDPAGLMNLGACSGTLWTTGSQLRISPDPAIAQRLAPGGPFPIDGLQANSLSLLRPQNTPPFGSYFIDFDDRTDVAGMPGHMGDVVVWRMCPGAVPLVMAQTLAPSFFDLVFEDTGCPAGTVRSRLQCISRPCPPEEFYRGGRCVKPECEPTRANQMCCEKGTRWNPRTRICEPPQGGDLTIRKIVIRCSPQGGPCTFAIRVTNTGDVPFTGPILVGDFLNSGSNLSLTAPAGWTCGPVPIPANLVGQLPPNGQTVGCINPNGSLAPGQSIDFAASATVQPALRAPWQNCAVVVVDPAHDSNFGNNKSCVKGDNGDQPKPKSGPNLTVEKIAPGSCTASGSQYTCEFIIRIRNTGDADYTGEVVVADGSLSGRISSVRAGADWTCTTSDNDRNATCRRAAGIGAGETLEFRVVTTEDGTKTKAQNCAALGDSIRRGDLGRPRTRLASMQVASDVWFRLAQRAGEPPAPGYTGPLSPLSCAEVELPKPVTERPRPDPVCPAGMIPTRTGCCSPESVAAGTCGGGGTTVDTCAPPSQLVNGVCCSAREIAAGTCGGTRVGTCSPPSQLVDGVCCSQRDIAAGTCGTNRVGTCQPPNRLMNNICCSPREIAAGTCGKVVDSCPGGAQRVRGQCQGTEKPKCQTGEWFQQGQCTRVGTCPDGSKPKAGQCRRPGKPDRPTCAGRIDTRGNCVTGPTKPKPTKPAVPGDRGRIINPPSRTTPSPGTKPIAPVKPGQDKPIQRGR
jgi:hypothetical protein